MKHARIALIAFAGIFPALTLAQAPADSASGWKRTASGLASLSQAYFDNWSQGGSDALNWEIRLEGGAVLDQTGYTWESKGKGVYGQTQLSGLSPRKSADELDFETIYTRKLNAWVNPFGALRFQSQFAPGYVYNDSAGSRAQTSDAFDPSYATQTLGVGYDWRKELQVRLGATAKETFGSAQYKFADDKETTGEVETFKFEPGASLNAAYKKVLMENILLTTALDVFANFKGWDEVDGRWQSTLAAKVNNFISVNFGLDVLYDRDLSADRQIKESLAVAISFLTI